MIQVHGKGYNSIGILPYAALDGKIYMLVSYQGNKICDIAKTLDPTMDDKDALPFKIAETLLQEACGPLVTMVSHHIYRIPESQKILYIMPVDAKYMKPIQSSPPADGNDEPPKAIWLSYADFMRGNVHSYLRPDELKNLLPLIMSTDANLLVASVAPWI